MSHRRFSWFLVALTWLLVAPQAGAGPQPGGHRSARSGPDGSGPRPEARGTAAFGGNLLANADFMGSAGWNFFTDGTGAFDVVDGEARITLADPGTNAQLYQNGLELEGDTEYRVGFYARSNRGQDLALVLRKHQSPYTIQGLARVFNLSTHERYFEVIFRTTPGAETDARLQFYFTPFDRPGDVYWLDYVVLEPLSEDEDEPQHEIELAEGEHCSNIARLAREACDREAEDDQLIALANCVNLSDEDDLEDCQEEAEIERDDADAECDEQFDARIELCRQLGEERFEPDFAPDNFVHPDEIGEAVEPNPYFPLVVGNRWVWQNEDEVITDTVLDKIKRIDGVPCRVVLDEVVADGFLLELTYDWYAQDLEGNVWYCGEASQEFEVFEGDLPQEPELVSIDGSWKAGRDASRPGTLVLRFPAVGDVYREEIALGEAEDAAEVISLTGSESVPAASCDGTCLVTRNFTPLEPGVEETKYYAPGVGLILEIDSEGHRIELVEFTATD